MCPDRSASGSAPPASGPRRVALLRLNILDYWHCSSGQADRAGVGTRVIRKDLLPLVPGRTLKGLLREAMTQAETFGVFKTIGPEKDRGLPPGGITDCLFGIVPLPADSPDTAGAIGEEDATAQSIRRYATESGALVVDDATLGPVWQAWARAEERRLRCDRSPSPLDGLGTVLTGTRLDHDGQIVAQTLRSLEVMPPMVLEAPITLACWPKKAPAWLTDLDGFDLLNKALPFFRALGSRRNRGLGRVEATLVDPATKALMFAKDDAA